MTPTKAQAMARLAAIGATFDGPQRDDATGWLHGFIDAPAGKVWSHVGTHCAAVCGANAPSLWCAVVSEISPLEDCVDVDCDVCAEAESR